MKFRDCVAFARNAIVAVRDVALWVIGVACLLLAIAMTVTDHTPAGTLLFGAGILLCLISTLSRFELIKGLGIEAKTRALDAKINEADELLDHIRDMSAVTAKMSFSTMARIGRWDSHLSKKEMLDFSDAFLKQLNSVGVSAETIEDCMQPVHKLNMQDLVRPIHAALSHHLTLKQQDLNEQMQKIPAPIQVDDPTYQRISAELSLIGSGWTRLSEVWPSDPAKLIEMIEALVSHLPLTTQAEKNALLNRLDEDIKDAQYYQAHRQFRDIKRWLSTSYG